ncbi:MAG: response regulator [Aristaeellaceae bacterium]
MRILIVDDEPKVRQRLKAMIHRLTPENSVLGEAGNGEEALALMAQSMPDIVMTDIRMPRMDGLQLFREIHQRGWTVGRIILSGYSDFAYTQQAMQQGIRLYLLKPVAEDELKHVLAQAVEELTQARKQAEELRSGQLASRERALVRLLNGHRMAKEQPTPFERCCLFVIEGDGERWDDAQEAMQALQSDTRLITPVGANRLVCCSAAVSALDEAVLLQATLTGRHRHITIAYSGPLKHAGEYHEVYRSLCALLDSRWLMQGSSILSLDDLPAESSFDVMEALRRWNHDALDRAIDLNDGPAMAQQTHRLFQMLSESRAEAEAGRAYFVEAVIHTMRHVTDRGGDPNAVLTQRLNIRELMTQYNIVELEQWYLELCRRIAAYLVEMRSRRPASVSRQIEALFQQDPSRSYTVNDLAEQFYMSPTYLHQVFKRETGQTIHAWLTARRIQLCKRALAESDDPVYEIAERYGYQNLRSFFTAFKRMEDCTPSEYRERMKHHE